ncbi:MAG TPA: GNAT family N-acetyltransferase [Burkholderiaceae bacterium]|nr:GNAT family N-acetyltransferase [Burkholderiaceae bacterium]
MTREIQHNQAHSRFEWTEDGQLCVLDYVLRDGVMAITHTGVPSSVGGRGIAADLARTALDTAREKGWKVRPLCSYVDAWMRRQRGAYDDLLAG